MLVDETIKFLNSVGSDEIKNKLLKKKIQPGDFVRFVSNDNQFVYFVNKPNGYASPEHGIICADTPLAQKFLGKFFGSKIKIDLNGGRHEYQLAVAF
jgi:transcription elongation GreA/GreB family factor